MSKTMCSCLKITKDDIRKSIENGSVCYKDIKKDTGIDTSSAGRLLCDDLELSSSAKLWNFLIA